LISKNYSPILAKINGIEIRAIFQQLSDDGKFGLTIGIRPDNPSFSIPLAIQEIQYFRQ
jgi:hypothetical protein